MKVKIMLGLLLVLGTALGATALSGSDPEPICIPGKPCQAEPKKFDDGPDPLCRPGIPCVEKKFLTVILNRYAVLVFLAKPNPRSSIAG